MIDRIQHRLFPELLRFNSRVAGRRALQLARTECLYSRRTLFRLLVLVGISIAADQFIKWSLVPKNPKTIYFADVVMLACLLYFSHRFRADVRKALRRFLRMDGVDVCIPCGHDTTGIEDSRCLECGSPLEDFDNK